VEELALAMEAAAHSNPTANCVIDIALHYLIGTLYGVYVTNLLGGRLLTGQLASPYPSAG
jgi:hypothetical protein